MRILIAGMLAAVLVFLACPAPEVETVEKPVDRVEILKNGASITDLSPTGYPLITLLEGKSVILSAKLDPAVKAGVHWQSGRTIVEFSQFNGQETVLFARYGGNTAVTVRAANLHNEAPVYGRLQVTVIPASWLKWDYQRDGWKNQQPLSSFEIGSRDNPLTSPGYAMLARAGNAPINEDPARGGIIMEGPATLVLGSVMASSTNSPYPEDPLFDETALMNFTKRPSDAGVNTPTPVPYALQIRVSADYEILDDPAPRQGMRLQVNNNTEERDNASALVNWLVAEYTADSPRSGTLTGIFDTSAAAIAQQLDQDKRDRIPGVPAIVRPDPGATPPVAGDTDNVIAEKQLRAVLSHSFVCLNVPDGKVLIRGIRIETEN